MSDLTDRAARVILSLVAEPGDADLAQYLTLVTPAEAVEYFAGDPANTALTDRIRPRMPRGGVLDDIAADTLAKASDRGIRFVTPDDSEYPSIGDLATPPVGLWMRGQRHVDDYSIAIVGARAATSYGEHIAGEFASDIARDGITVISGAAYGIDGTAHRMTLAAGGTTVAYLAGGLDRPYPPGHVQLIDRIIQHGTLISEVPPGFSPTRWRFQARQRLIAAAADATIVVEAGYRSGSLAVATEAHQLGRKVYAVPGPLTSAASAGCHRLIQDGIAQILTSVDQIDRVPTAA